MIFVPRTIMFKSDQIQRKFIEVHETSDWDVWTDSGWQPIESSNKTIQYRKYVLTTESGKTLECADDHIIFDETYAETYAKDATGRLIQTVDGLDRVLSVINSGVDEHMYDLSVNSEDHRFYSNGILSHNSTVAAGYIAWLVLFSSEPKNACVLANKLTTAKEIFGRIQFIIENCPKWMQRGVKEWSKLSFKFENESRVFCAATSPSAIRGASIHCVLLDEFAFLSPNLAEEFIASVFPTLSSSDTSKMIIVSTPKGMNHYYKLWREAEQGLNGFSLLSATWRDHPHRTQAWADAQLAELGQLKYNQEVECEFLGSSSTLINGPTIAAIPIAHTEEIFEGYREYHQPIEKHSYIIVSDVARGAELDYSAFLVIDVTELPYKISAVFRNNKIDPQMYPEVIHRIAKKYNEAFVLIETNDIGQQVADILFYDLEYENVYMSFREKINEGQGKKIPGLRTTKKTKAHGCSQLKTLVENNMIEINDYNIIDEMSVFVRVGTSYKAEEGKTDDLMMCLVMFAYLTQQSIFKELFDFSLREVYLRNQRIEWDDLMEPIGFVDRGEVPLTLPHGQNYIEATESWADFPML